MASTMLLPEKGLENRPGQNNCFLNVCIQALWHLGAFRSQFMTSKDHVHKENSCIYCALKVLFNGYQFSEEQVLPPTALRNTLAVLHRGLDRFQVGELDDAAEALEAILTCLNKVYLVKGNETAKKADESNPNSISNKVFGCPVVEIVQCGKCKKEIKPQGSDSFIYYTYVTEIREEHRKHPDLQFDGLLKRLSDSVTRSCPNDKCEEKRCTVRKVLLQQPHVFAVGLVWPTPNPTAYEIVDTLSVISQQIRLSNIFDGVPVQFTYRLKGMICYYGLHYDCYFYSPQRKQWLVFDDRVVKEVGASWEQLKDRCRRGRFHPSVLFYERVETGAPLPTTFTPKFYPQPITLNRNMFTPSGPTVPGFALAPPPAAAAGAYPGMQHHPFVPYPHQHPGFPQGYVHPPYAAPPAHHHHPQHSGAPIAASPQAVAPTQQQQQEERAENERRQEMAHRAEAERRKKQKEAEEEQQLLQRQQKEAEEKRAHEEDKRRQLQAAAAAAEGESDDSSEEEGEEEEEESGEESEREAAARRMAAEQRPAPSVAPRVEPPKSLPAPLVPTPATVAHPPAIATEPAPRSASLTGSSSSSSSISSASASASPSAPPLSSGSSSSSSSSFGRSSPPPVMVEDLLSTDDVFADSSPVVPPLRSATAGAGSTASGGLLAMPYTPSFSPSVVAAAPGSAGRAAPPQQTQSSAAATAPSAYSEFNFPSVPTAPLPSPPVPPSASLHSASRTPAAYGHSADEQRQQQPSILSSVDGYNDYSSKIDSIGQSKYLSLSKPGFSSSSTSSYSRPSTTTTSLFSSSSSSSSSTTSSFSRPATASTASRPTFGSSSSTTSSSSSSSSSAATAAARKKPQTSAFTNLSSLLSN